MMLFAICQVSHVFASSISIIYNEFICINNFIYIQINGSQTALLKKSNFLGSHHTNDATAVFLILNNIYCQELLALLCIKSLRNIILQTIISPILIKGNPIIKIHLKLPALHSIF